MSSSFKFLAHDIFQKNVRDFLEKYQEHKKSLFANLERARSSPFSGKPMHSLPKKLRQKVFRLWVGGASDFRFIYFVNKKQSSVFGIYLTLIPRAKFSYDNEDWIEALEQVVDDLENQKYDQFSQMDTEKAAKSL